MNFQLHFNVSIKNHAEDNGVSKEKHLVFNCLKLHLQTLSTLQT